MTDRAAEPQPFCPTCGGGFQYVATCTPLAESQSQGEQNGTEAIQDNTVSSGGDSMLRDTPGDSRTYAQVAEPQLGDASHLRDQILEMMNKRDWSTHWIHRSAYLHLESAELAEAVRGKRGDTLDESADVLITMLALSPHALPEIIGAAVAKVAALMTKPRYPGETGTFGDQHGK